MDMQKTKTIVIATSTALSAFIVVSPFVSSCLWRQTVTFFFIDMLAWTSFAVFAFAVLSFAAMWGWRFPPELKVILVMLHLILAALAGFWVWLLWFAEFPAGAA